MKKENAAILFFYLFLLAVVIVLWLSGCSPVKQVLRDPVKTNKVVWSWMQDHPFRNDTVTIKGKDSLRIDTVESTETVSFLNG